MEEEGLFGTEKANTYFGTWNGIGGWNTYTGDKK